jgi:hypothetical protein
VTPAINSVLKVASRISAALFVSYLATWVLTYAAALLVPLPRTEAVITTSLLAIVVYLALMIWSFVADLRIVWSLLVALILVGAAAAVIIGGLP